MKTLPILALGVLLFACTQTAPNTTSRRDLGALEVAFSDGVSSARFTPNRLSSQATAVNESQLTFTSDSQVAYVNSAQTDSRILVARFKIANATGANINRLTLVAWAKTGNLGRSALNRMTNFGGLTIGTTLQQTNQAILTEPVHATSTSSANPSVDSSNADLQLLTEAETKDLETLTGFSNQLLPYGFVARNNTNAAANRRVVNSSNTNADGTVTLALRVPRNNSNTYSFFMTFRVIAEPTTQPIYVQSLEEQVNSTFGGESPSSILAAFPNASLRILPGGDQNLRAAGMVNTRIAGTRSNVTGVLRPWLYAPTSNSVSVGFSELAIPSGFGVRREVGPEGALEPVPSTLSRAITFRAPSSSSPFAPNENLQGLLKAVQDRDGLQLFPNVLGRGYGYERRAPDRGTSTSCTACNFNNTNTATFTPVSGVNLTDGTAGFANIDSDSAQEMIVVYSNISDSTKKGNIFFNVYDLTSTTSLFQASTSNNQVLDSPKILTGDLNNDGKTDVAVIGNLGTATETNPTGNGIYNINVWLNTSSGSTVSFVRQTPVSVEKLSGDISTEATLPNQFRTWDANQDGSLDLVLGSTKNLYIVLNNGNGTFGDTSNVANLWASVPVGGDSNMNSYGDTDNDGDLDVVQINPFPSTKTYTTHRFNTVSGGYSSILSELWLSYTDPSGTSTGDQSGTLADVNNDGYLDMVTRDKTVFGTSNVVSDKILVYLNNGLGGFADTPVSSTFACQFNRRPPISTLDVNHDGNLDLVVECRSVTGANRYGLAKGNGDGSFTADGTFSSDYYTPLVSTDWDNDGDLDLVGITVQASTGSSNSGFIIATAYLNN
jgi:hypothetical protein